MTSVMVIELRREKVRKLERRKEVKKLEGRQEEKVRRERKNKYAESSGSGRTHQRHNPSGSFPITPSVTLIIPEIIRCREK